MGNLLRMLARDGVVAADCFSAPKSGQRLFVDFESAVPRSQDEHELYTRADQILGQGQAVLEQLQQYKGATNEIREAIQTRSSEKEEEALVVLLPLVQTLKGFYVFSARLTEMVTELLRMLCTVNGSRDSIVEQLDEYQALVKQFAHILHFVLKFDECKMVTPAIQNDFSYYRRTAQRRRSLALSSEDDDEPGSHSDPIPVDVANAMSLFFAHATPMLNALSATTSKFVDDCTKNNASNVADNTTEMLSVVAKVCQKMLDTPELKARLKYEETEPFILRVMVAAIILYDHVHPAGAFARGSGVDIKGCVSLLREYENASLLNALRYTTKHVNDETTPKNTKALIFDP